VEVSHKFATPKTLVQQYCFVPAKHKDCYLAYVLNEFAGQTILVFAATCNGKQRKSNSNRHKSEIAASRQPYFLFLS
jgi:superfamily II DNA/RNA helicase